MPSFPPDDQQTPSARKFVVSVSAVALAFSLPLWGLLLFAAQSRLYSHILLIPFISLYFVRQKRATLPSISTPDRPLALLFLMLGSIVLGAYAFLHYTDTDLAPVDNLSMTTLSWLLMELAVCSWFLGRPLLKALTFPLAFLIFMVPFPNFVETGTETLLQHGSAFVAQTLFSVAGTTFFANGLVFELPGITFQVAPECSGIHSSLVLFITSIVSGQLILRSNPRRILLAAAVIPLALLRNGFRVFVIGELCVRIGPHMIDSFIHHQGGPIFFALSLVPFFTLLAWLIKSERKAASRKPSTSS